MFRMILMTLGALFGFLAWFGTPELNPRLAEASAPRAATFAPALQAPAPAPAAMVREVAMHLTPVQAAPAPQEQTQPAKPRFPGPPLEPSPQYADAPPAAAGEAPPAAEGALTVTGDRVNLRAGPGTDHPVVGAVARGAAVTAVGPTTGAWVEVRDASGLQGFISARFLSPARAD